MSRARRVVPWGRVEVTRTLPADGAAASLPASPYTGAGSRSEGEGAALCDALHAVDELARLISHPADRAAALGLVRGRLERHLGQALRERRAANSGPAEHTGD